MKSIYILLASIFFFAQFGWSQKTYFLNTERETESLFINDQQWSGKAFFEVDSEKPLLQVIVREKGYKSEYDILSEDTNHSYTAPHFINVDTNIISIIKPIDIEFVKEGFDFETHKLDYATYLKDLDHDGQLQSYNKMDNEAGVLNDITLDNQYLINEINEYHNNTIGRYKFYSLGTIHSVRIYEVTMKDNEKFVQAYVTANWSITGNPNNTEDLMSFPHLGKSGKIVISDANNKTADMLTLAVHDAVIDSLFYFLEQQELKLVKALGL